MKRVIPACLALMLATFPAFSQTPHPPSKGPYLSVTKFDPSRNADRDIREAIAEAKRSNRRVLLDVGGEWCVWCRRLDTLFVSNKALATFRDMHFVTVKVNYSKENKNEEVLSRYPKIPGYPHLFVLDKEGKLLCSQDTGALESGKGHDPAKVRNFLREWAEPVEESK
jgi:thiol:disulfide interchange protein